MTSRYQAVVFDAYGTLFDVHSIAALAEQLFPGQGNALSQLWRAKQLEYSWLRAMSRRYKPFWQITIDALRYCCDRLNLPLTPALEQRLLAQYAKLGAFPENLAALAQMKNAGLPLAILTNGNLEMIQGSVAAAGMAGIFDHLLSSESVDTFKTMPAIYDLAPAAFGLPAGEILFVSSNCWDAIGSRWYGYASFWINRLGAPLDRLDVEPNYTGRSLNDVAAVALTGGVTH